MRVILLAVTISAAASSSCGTGSSCGLALVQQLVFPRPDQSSSEPVGEVACCGASMFQDFNLSVDNIQMDLVNLSGSNARVDAFLTSGDCTRLFNGSYAGTATAPQCTIYIGPVAAGAVSGRKSIRRGKYRVFEQAYSSNETPAQFVMEIGLWAEACHWNPIQP